MKKKKIGIIGGGNMGEALIKGLYKSHSIFVCEADAVRARNLKNKYHVSTGDLGAVTAQSSAVILAVKPQDMEAVLKQITGIDGKLFISIAAGLTTKFFEKLWGGKARVVRAMPNMPALIGEGMTAICKGRYATRADMQEAAKILAAVGVVLEFQEKYMDAITAVSGSGPAYVFLFIEQWVSAAKSLGLNEKDAQHLVRQTLKGSIHLMRKSEFTASELRAMVTSKGGTTEAAMKIFFKGDALGKLMKNALGAAKKRAKALSK